MLALPDSSAIYLSHFVSLMSLFPAQPHKYCVVSALNKKKLKIGFSWYRFLSHSSMHYWVTSFGQGSAMSSSVKQFFCCYSFPLWNDFKIPLSEVFVSQKASLKNIHCAHQVFPGWRHIHCTPEKPLGQAADTRISLTSSFFWGCPRTKEFSYFCVQTDYSIGVTSLQIRGELGSINTETTG